MPGLRYVFGVCLHYLRAFATMAKSLETIHLGGRTKGWCLAVCMSVISNSMDEMISVRGSLDRNRWKCIVIRTFGFTWPTTTVPDNLPVLLLDPWVYKPHFNFLGNPPLNGGCCLAAGLGSLLVCMLLETSRWAWYERSRIGDGKLRSYFEPASSSVL
jgi:hypothetical protein